MPPSWAAWPEAEAAAPPPAGSKDALYLAPGWNLVSVPAFLADGSVAGVLATSPGVDEVYSYSAASQSWAHAERGVAGWTGDAIEVSPGGAYWMRAISGTQVPLVYAEMDPLVPPPVHELAPGWNLVGFTSLSFSDGMDRLYYLGSLGEGWSVVLRHDPDGGMAYSTPQAGFTDIERGRGYYVYLKEGGVLVP